jgi:hypothetical protein
MTAKRNLGLVVLVALVVLGGAVVYQHRRPHAPAIISSLGPQLGAPPLMSAPAVDPAPIAASGQSAPLTGPVDPQKAAAIRQIPNTATADQLWANCDENVKIHRLPEASAFCWRAAMAGDSRAVVSPGFMYMYGMGGAGRAEGRFLDDKARQRRLASRAVQPRFLRSELRAPARLTLFPTRSLAARAAQ